MFKVDIDLTALQNITNPEAALAIAEEAAHDLTLLTHAKLIELAKSRLKTRFKQFTDNLPAPTFDDGVWVIQLNEDAAWINDGLDPFDMLPGLLYGDKAKKSKAGDRYLVVPFDMAADKGGPTTNTPYQMDLVNAVKKEMKNRKIPWKTIELDDQKRPKLGLIHKIKLKTPNKTGMGPGQGWGAVGDQRQGLTGTPFLEGAAVYQKEVKGKVQRSVTTFRTASEKHLGSGRWFHPGLEKTNIFEDAYDWALAEVETHIMPEIIKKIEQAGSF